MKCEQWIGKVVWSHDAFFDLVYLKRKQSCQKGFESAGSCVGHWRWHPGVGVRCRKRTFSSPSLRSSASQVAAHDWTRTDSSSSKCQVCHKKIKTLTGRRCVWCHEMVRMAFSAVRLGSSHCRSVLSLLKRHDECLFSGLSSCDCGPLRDHILPPWAIYAVSKVRKRSHTKTNITMR